MTRAIRNRYPLCRLPMALVTGLTALLLAAPVASAKPKGEFAVFSGCPLAVTGVNECVWGQSSSGELVFGKMTVPIKNPISFQGGLKVTESSETFVSPSEGTVLSKTPEEIPGGFGSPSEPITVTLETVGTVTMSKAHFTSAEGVAITLPVRAHLKALSLGEGCFVGSSTKPITLQLTTGTTSPPEPNKPITGTPGTLELKEEGTLAVYNGDSLVDNAFSVPSAEGCGTLGTPIVNSKYGLPSAAGHNRVVLKGKLEFATAEAVKNSE